MVRIDVFKIERKTKQFLWPIVGAALIIVGIALIFKYIIDFIRIFIGFAFIFIGFYLIYKQKFVRNFAFFRF